MMGGDPSLARHLKGGQRKKFWTRIKGQGDRRIQVVCAVSIQQINERLPSLEVFEPEENWQARHEGELFREYDIEKDFDELTASLRDN